MLWRHWKTLQTSAVEDNDESTHSQSSEDVAGLSFLFQNYKIRRWYWKFVETGKSLVRHISGWSECLVRHIGGWSECLGYSHYFG